MHLIIHHPCMAETTTSERENNGLNSQLNFVGAILDSQVVDAAMTLVQVFEVGLSKEYF